MVKPFIIITGMHRSGTSFLSRALNLSGLYLGKTDSLFSIGVERSSDNLRGHWEHQHLKDLADSSLSFNGGTWDLPPNKIEIPHKISEQIIKETSTLTSHPSLASGFKDPRMCLLYDSWKDYLPTKQIVVGIFRHPLKVAESLKTRDNFSYEKSLQLWKIYNKKLLQIIENNNGFLLDFDWTPEKLFDEVNLISQKLGLVENMNLSKWFDNSLLRADSSFDISFTLPNDITQLYEELKICSIQNASTPKINNEFDSMEVMRGFLLEIFSQHEYFQKTLQEKDNYLKQVIQEKDNYLKQVIQEKDNYLRQIQEELRSIKQSKIMKTLRKIDRLLGREE